MNYKFSYRFFFYLIGCGYKLLTFNNFQYLYREWLCYCCIGSATNSKLGFKYVIPRSALSLNYLISLDFAKAFNSMCHVHCVDTLRRMNVSAATTDMIQAFLHGRQMQFKVGNTVSTKRLLKGGAPQGTLLGNFLFMMATNELESPDQPQSHLSGTNQDEPSVLEEQSVPDQGSSSSLSMSRDEPIFSDASPSPVRHNGTSTPIRLPPTRPSVSPQSADDDSFVHFASYRRPINRLEDTNEDLTINTLDGSNMIVLQPPKLAWTRREDASLKYVDDLLASEHIPITSAYSIFSTGKPKAIAHTQHCQCFFSTVKKNAEAVGMTVNDEKTQLLGLSAVQDRDFEVYIRLDSGKKIQGQDKLRQLGFTFSKRPTVDAHIEETSLKFRKRLWYLRHLKSAGLPEVDLIAMYKCFLLSVLDYASVVYGLMLTKEQAQALEKLQSSALKVIYGLKYSYGELLERSGVEMFCDRRQCLINRFVLKTVKNEALTDLWFPTKEFVHHDLRREKIFEEHFA